MDCPAAAVHRQDGQRNISGVRRFLSLPDSFMTCPSAKRLEKQLGGEGVAAWLKLLFFALRQRPDGVLAGMSADDVAWAAGWDGQAELFVHVLLHAGLLERTGENLLRVVEWEVYNQFQDKAQQRRQAARKAACARWAKTDAGANRVREEEGLAGDVCIPLAATDALGNALYYTLTASTVRKLALQYPDVDVHSELQRLAQWNHDNPGRRKTRSSILQHIRGWLGRANASASQHTLFSRPARPAGGAARQEAFREMAERIRSLEAVNAKKAKEFAGSRDSDG